MSRPWMPLYIGDYLADTGNLTTLQHGAYLLLIMHYWRHRGLPSDAGELSSIARLPLKQWSSIAPAISKLFHGNWQHTRIDKELALADAQYEKRVNAGKKGGLAHSNAQAMLKQSQPQSPSPREDKKDIRSVARATRPPLNADFLKFKEAYPKRDGPNPWTPAEKLFLAAIKSGHVAGEIIAGAARYHAEADRLKYTGTERVAQAKTWLNQARWQDYAPTTNGAAPTGFTLTENTPQQWDAWRAGLVAGGADVRFMDAQREKGGAYRVQTEWPPDIPKAEAAE